ncbi:Clp protease N-terminal domain-containing protein [Amycolatopsis sp. NPDC059021]|uniref:Clp protease N-terminal domain-containing protein n=1 Tax=Amycolatopsis sp. NPDC059021 TaxID=3346704 RepID=UPI00366B5109
MFERFTPDVRFALVDAQRLATEMGSREIEPLHLLAELVRSADSDASRLLTRLGVSRDDIAGELERFRRRGGITDTDAEALTELGIDVEQIVERIEQAHGPGALAGPGQGRRGKRAHLPFAPTTKKLIEGSLRQAVEIGDKILGQDHLLLALAAQQGVAADLLARHGADYPTLRRAMRERKAG